MKDKKGFAMLWQPAVNTKVKGSTDWTEQSIQHGIDYFISKYHIIPTAIILRNPEKIDMIANNLVGVDIIASHSVAEPYIVIASDSEAYFGKERKNNADLSELPNRTEEKEE